MPALGLKGDMKLEVNSGNGGDMKPEVASGDGGRYNIEWNIGSVPLKIKIILPIRQKSRKIKEVISFLVFVPINRNHHFHTENKYRNMPGSKYTLYWIVEKCKLYNINMLIYCQDVNI